PAYAGVAEHSVYVARAARGSGAGGVALDALCDVYAARGFHKLVSRIFPENTASLALHERCGFRVVGVYRRQGMLDGAWRDCVIVEKLLGGMWRASTPRPPRRRNSSTRKNYRYTPQGPQGARRAHVDRSGAGGGRRDERHGDRRGVFH